MSSKFNARSNTYDRDDVQAFWRELVTAWRSDPRIHLREIEWTLRYAAAELAGVADEVLPRQLDPIPTIGYDGSVILLSPELAGFSDPRFGDFSSGNVLREPLHVITARAAHPGALAGGPMKGELVFLRDGEGLIARSRLLLTAANAAELLPGEGLLSGRLTLNVATEGPGMRAVALVG